MTAHSRTIVAADSGSHRGSQLATSFSNPIEFRVPPAIDRALGLSPNKFAMSDSFDECRALGLAKRHGLLEAIPALAEKAAAALVPVDRNRLLDRLTLLGMSMANGKDAEQVRAWLHETVRLLEDLPECVLFPAIDDCVREPGRVFCPSVGEIRAKAAQPLREREVQAVRLRRMAKSVLSGEPIPDLPAPRSHPDFPSRPAPDAPVCTPEEAAAILKEYGLPSTFAAAGFLKPAQSQTRAETVAEGITPPPIEKPTEASRGREFWP